MKTNIFKSSIMALAIVSSFSACTQDELGTEATTSEDALNVIAYSNDFVSSDAESRVTEDDYTTKFEENDAIGIFVVRDGQALVSNMKMTLGNDKTWKGENNSSLYYYKDANYIAYYPYIEGLTATSESDIVKIFTDKLTADQGTAEAYRNADLMSVTVPAANVERGGDISFNMAHKMSMIELKIPVRRYTTADTDGYEYSVPTKIDLEINGNAFTPYTFADGVYRCIVAASATEDVTVKGCFYDGDIPVYFPKSTAENADPSESVTPNEGTYKCLNIKYSSISEDVVVRPIEVGDYFYEDGNIYPYGNQDGNDLSTPPSAGCVGIVFSTTVSESALTECGYNHGYVVALKNTSGVVGSTGYDYWGNGTLTNNSLTSGNDWSGIDNGYTASISTELSNLDAVKAAKGYNVALPDNTSGWYLPSVKQIVDILNNLATVSSWTFNTVNAYNQNTDATQKKEMLNQIQSKFDEVGGIMLKDDESNYTDRWWTTTEVSNTEAWCLEMNISDGKTKLLNRNKNGNSYHKASVRPVFAF